MSQAKSPLAVPGWAAAVFERALKSSSPLILQMDDHRQAYNYAQRLQAARAQARRRTPNQAHPWDQVSIVRPKATPNRILVGRHSLPATCQIFLDGREITDEVLNTIPKPVNIPEPSEREVMESRSQISVADVNQMLTTGQITVDEANDILMKRSKAIEWLAAHSTQPQANQANEPQDDLLGRPTFEGEDDDKAG